MWQPVRQAESHLAQMESWSSRGGCVHSPRAKSLVGTSLAVSAARSAGPSGGTGIRGRKRWTGLPLQAAWRVRRFGLERRFACVVLRPSGGTRQVRTR